MSCFNVRHRHRSYTRYCRGRRLQDFEGSWQGLCYLREWFVSFTRIV